MRLVKISLQDIQRKLMKKVPVRDFDEDFSLSDCKKLSVIPYMGSQCH